MQQVEEKKAIYRMKTSDVRFLRNTLKAISVVADEITLEINSEEIKIREMDPSCVSMVDFCLSTRWFDEFEYSTTETRKIRINVKKLVKLLKNVECDETIEFIIDAVNGFRVAVIDEGTCSFIIPILAEPFHEEFEPPRLRSNVKAEIAASTFNKAIKTIQLFNNYVRIEANDDSFILNTLEGEPVVTIAFRRGRELKELETKAFTRAVYNLNYLTGIVKEASLTSHTVAIEFATDTPLKLDFQRLCGDKLTYYLAPYQC